MSSIRLTAFLFWACLNAPTGTLAQQPSAERVAEARRLLERARRWLLYHVLTHAAYHGGQAVLLALQHKRRA